LQVSKHCSTSPQIAESDVIDYWICSDKGSLIVASRAA